MLAKQTSWAITSSARDRLVDYAHHQVDVAVRIGLLRPAKMLSCADCGEAAFCYDHRDYRYPLEVTAVCQTCNNRRGPGLPQITEEDHHQTKHILKIETHQNGGHCWSNLDAGEGFAPLERRVNYTPEILQAIALVEQREEGSALRNKEAPLDYIIKHNGRSDYFKRHDPLFFDDMALA
jgi:hypothetical protein